MRAIAVVFGSPGNWFLEEGLYDPDYIQPAVQMRKVVKLLELVAIRVNRGEISETLESSREMEETGFEISPPSVITVSRGDCLATGKIIRDELDPCGPVD